MPPSAGPTFPKSLTPPDDLTVSSMSVMIWILFLSAAPPTPPPDADVVCDSAEDAAEHFAWCAPGRKRRGKWVASCVRRQHGMGSNGRGDGITAGSPRRKMATCKRSWRVKCPRATESSLGLLCLQLLLYVREGNSRETGKKAAQPCLRTPREKRRM